MPYTPTQRVALVLVPRLAALLIRLLGCTLRYHDVYDQAVYDPAHPSPVPADTTPGPSVYAFWHRSLLAFAYRFRGKGLAILISRSFDGELIARTVERLGFLPVRGSSSRGGTSALRTLAEAYREGHHCAITVDGPRGPAMRAQPGAAQLAQLVGAEWIGTCYALPTRAWTLNTWDRFLIPRPFATVLLAWPPRIPTAARTTAELQSAVQSALDQAVALAGSPPSRFTEAAPEPSSKP